VDIVTRRNFIYGAALASACAAVRPILATKTKHRNIQIGHTGITWPNTAIDQAIASIASLGFYGFETFGDVLVKWEDQGGIGTVLEKNHIPLISSYCTINLTEPSQRAAEMEKALKWCGLIKKYNGRIFVVGPNQVKRDSYDFAANNM